MQLTVMVGLVITSSYLENRMRGSNMYEGTTLSKRKFRPKIAAIYRAARRVRNGTHLGSSHLQGTS